jgi:hypothetical protein
VELLAHQVHQDQVVVQAPQELVDLQAHQAPQELAEQEELVVVQELQDLVEQVVHLLLLVVQVMFILSLHPQLP